MEKVETGLLDCVAVNVAVILASYGVADPRPPFAAEWRFEVRDSPGPGRPPVVDLPSPALPRRVLTYAGYRLDWAPVAGGELAVWEAACRGGRPVLVVGDAYHMPWLPYAGREHIEHSFLVAAVAGDILIVDGYENHTQWGAAAPSTAVLDRSSLPALLRACDRWTTLEPVHHTGPPVAARTVRENAEAILSAGASGVYDRFLESYQELTADALAALAVQTWLLARDRAAHAGWLRDHACGTVAPSLAEEFRGDVAGAWARANELVYIAGRRVSAGRTAPVALVADLIERACEQERRLARQLLESVGRGERR